MVVKATYADGVFRAKGAVALPENSEVEFEPRLISEHSSPDTADAMKAVIATLSQRVSNPEGPHDLAARHNEHLP